MQNNYNYVIKNPSFESLGYLVAVADITDKHDRSAPSHFHWKILKCRTTEPIAMKLGMQLEIPILPQDYAGKIAERLTALCCGQYKNSVPNQGRMIIFSNSSILACPDKNEIKRVHIVFNKMGDDYDKLSSLFLKFSLVQGEPISTPSADLFQMCLNYTLTAKLAPSWNTIGTNYLINNRDFLNSKIPEDGVRYSIRCNDQETVIELKPIKIHFINDGNDVFIPGEWVRVLPSLNKAVIEEYFESLPSTGNFKCYKDLRRHWKNIHGYRLPEEESPYYSVRFWRGDPLTYPKTCIVRNFPVITPVPKNSEKRILFNFITYLKSRISQILGKPFVMQLNDNEYIKEVKEKSYLETQEISLCTPTQHQIQNPYKRKKY